MSDSQQSIIVEDDRTGLHVETLKRALLDNLFYIAGRFAASATRLASIQRSHTQCATAF